MTEFYHSGVVCSLVDYERALPLDIELLAPSEGEAAAAQRLLARVLERYPRFFDAIVADAAYLKTPFLRFSLEHELDMVAVLKKLRSIFSGMTSAAEGRPKRAACQHAPFRTPLLARPGHRFQFIPDSDAPPGGLRAARTGLACPDTPT